MRKLLKYDFKALFRVILPVNLLLLLTALTGCISITVLFGMNNNKVEDDFFSVIRSMTSIGSSLTLMFVLIVISMAYFVTVVVVCVRYYKNMITDEAYLTFTLPRKTGQIFASKFISGYVGMIITSLFVFIGYGMVGFTFLVNMSKETGISLSETFEGVSKVVSEGYRTLIEDELFDIHPVAFIVIGIFLLIIVAAKQLLLPYTCMNLGGCIAKKYKLLCAIGVYFGFTFVSSIVYTVLRYVSMYIIYSSPEMKASSLFALIVLYTLFELAITVLLWFISTIILKKKLNLQ